MPENDIDPYNWLESEDGICKFTGPESRQPTRIMLASPGISLLSLIQSLLVIDPEEDAIQEIKWKPGDEIPDGVLGAKLKLSVVKFLQDTYGDDAILLAAPNHDAWMTLSEWREEFGTDGLAMIIQMRLFWSQHGGGVVAGKPAKVFKKLGRC